MNFYHWDCNRFLVVCVCVEIWSRESLRNIALEQKKTAKWFENINTHMQHMTEYTAY